MNYIWEPLIQRMQQASAPEKLCYMVQGKRVSPYLELQPDSLYHSGEEMIQGDTFVSVDVNPYLRFESVFEPFVTADDLGYGEFNEAFGDILLHYLADFDFKSGMCKQEFYLRFLILDMENGIFGGEEESSHFSIPEKRTLAEGIRSLYQTSDSMASIMDTAWKLFPFCQIFIRDAEELVFYMREERTEHAESRLCFFIRLFLPVTIPYAVHWTKTYGVAGYDTTMKLGEFIL